jgi:hypothetical protein
MLSVGYADDSVADKAKDVFRGIRHGFKDAAYDVKQAAVGRDVESLSGRTALRDAHQRGGRRRHVYCNRLGVRGLLMTYRIEYRPLRSR